ncbi:TPA: helix-turn-helix domain-containing protein [Morganella morganii]
MKKDMSSNIFEILTSDPVSLNLWNIKSNLILVIHKEIIARNWNQTEAAKHLGISQPRVSSMLKGNLDKFSVDALLGMLFKLGYNLNTIYSNSLDNPINIELKKVTQ